MAQDFTPNLQDIHLEIDRFSTKEIRFDFQKATQNHTSGQILSLILKRPKKFNLQIEIYEDIKLIYLSAIFKKPKELAGVKDRFAQIDFSGEAPASLVFPTGITDPTEAELITHAIEREIKSQLENPQR